MSSAVRIGVIGVGTMGFAHAKYLYRNQVKGGILSALCDIDPERRKELAECFPDIPIFESADDLFAAGLCDAVVIATPHYYHVPIGISAFENGLHVLSEKPMAVQLSEAKRMIDVAKSSGKTFCVMFNQRTNSLFKKTKELIEDGAIGQPKRLTWIITNWYRTQKYYDSGSWRATWDGEGGGVLMNQAPHNLDLWQWIFGMPARIRAFCAEGKYHDIEVEDDALIYAEYENGASAVFQTTTGEYPGTNRLEICGDRGKLVLENGVLKYWRLLEAEREFCFKSKDSFAKIPMEYRELTFSSSKNAHGTVLQNYVDHILDPRTELISNGIEAANEVMLANAAYLSSWQDGWVELPIDADLFDRKLKSKREQSVQRERRSASEKTEYQERWQVRW